jgi:predicted amidohydrolase YtcJ
MTVSPEVTSPLYSNQFCNICVIYDKVDSGHSSATKGVFVHEEEVLSDMMAQAYLAGYRLEVHAIGDAAAERVLNALERSELLINGSSDCDHLTKKKHFRPILTHCQVLGADLIEKMAKLGVVANIQPSFVPTGMILVISMCI